MEKVYINKLAAPTFRWLGVNFAEAELPEKSEKEESFEYDFGAYSENRRETEISAEEGLKCTQAVIRAEKGSKNVVIQKLSGTEISNSYLNIATDALLEENSELTLVQLFESSDGLTVVNNLKAEQKDGSVLKLIQLFSGSGRVYSESRSELNGYKSEFENDCAYLVKGKGVLDINLDVNHRGKKSKSNIEVNGVLRDSAEKTFRGTINFIKGASGSEGAEKEDVLIMDDGAVNKSVPLILCDEEDVAGAHGASIGRLDDELIYYLGARGLTREEIYELMAKARIDALKAKIPVTGPEEKKEE